MRYTNFVAPLVVAAGFVAPATAAPSPGAIFARGCNPPSDPVNVDGTDKYLQAAESSCGDLTNWGLTQAHMDDLSGQFKKDCLSGNQGATYTSSCISHGSTSPQWSAKLEMQLFEGWTLYDFGPSNSEKVSAGFLTVRSKADDPKSFWMNLYKTGSTERIGWLQFTATDSVNWGCYLV